MPLPVNDTVGPSVTMKCRSNGKIAKTNVCSPIFANFSMSTDGGFIKKFPGIVLTSEEDEYATLLPVAKI